MLRGPSPCSGLIILYYPNRGWGVPSNIYRGPRGPSFAVEGFPPCFTGVPGDPLIRHNIFCKHFVAGLGEACKVPPISAGVPASCVRIPSLFHIASGVTRRKRVGFLIFCRGPQRLVGGKREWFLQFLLAPLPHTLGFPTFFTLLKASRRGRV